METDLTPEHNYTPKEEAFFKAGERMGKESVKPVKSEEKNILARSEKELSEDDINAWVEQGAKKEEDTSQEKLQKAA